MSKGRSPAFQFYPEKFIAGTDHLSDQAFRIYMRCLCWMWINSEDFSSIKNEESFISRRMKITKAKYKKYWLGEIMHPDDPKLKEEGNVLVSNGLRKEAVKQKRRSDAGARGANVRWGHDEPQCDGNANAPKRQSPLSPSPPSGNNKRSWMTPFGEIWEEMYGGEMPYSQYARDLKKVVDRHGEELAIKGWRSYLKDTEPQYANAARFQQTSKRWCEKAAQPVRPPY